LLQPLILEVWVKKTADPMSLPDICALRGLDRGTAPQQRRPQTPDAGFGPASSQQLQKPLPIIAFALSAVIATESSSTVSGTLSPLATL
jgi:hypothetical protein